MVSAARRDAIIGALRRGTVPSAGLDALAVGIERLAPTFDADLDAAGAGAAVFKSVRGDYGAGKTFFGRWLQERARARGFATSEVQISETETPLHRMETVYRRLVERLATADAKGLLERTEALMEQRLAGVSRVAPAFAGVLRAYRRALAAGDAATAEGLIAWLSGQPNVAAAVKRMAGVKGDLDHFGAANFLAGLLVILRDSGYAGLVWVLDEVETLQRMRGDTREKGLNALRQWIDEIDAGRFPGLVLVVTGTPAFFDGPQGVQRLAPLAQRLHTDFATDRRFDNPRAPQVRLAPFDTGALTAVGRRVRDLFAEGRPMQERVRAVADDAYIEALARAVTGHLGGQVGVAPRLFLKKLVAEVLDRVELHADFDPRLHYALTVAEHEMTVPERAASGAASVDDIEL